VYVCACACGVVKKKSQSEIMPREGERKEDFICVQHCLDQESFVTSRTNQLLVILVIVRKPNTSSLRHYTLTSLSIQLFSNIFMRRSRFRRKALVSLVSHKKKHYPKLRQLAGTTSIPRNLEGCS
jgi:hypothetical protein